MMTGPEHYREAEECAARSRKTSSDNQAYSWLGEAQVHATLALAAATAAQLDTLQNAEWWHLGQVEASDGRA